MIIFREHDTDNGSKFVLNLGLYCYYGYEQEPAAAVHIVVAAAAGTMF